LKSQLDSRIEQLKEIKSILNGSHKDLLRWGYIYKCRSSKEPYG
jgi:hypothetical protein